MNVDRQRAVTRLLEDTLEDGRLSREEARRISDALDGLAGDPASLDFVRNAAFRLVAERSTAADRPLLHWLELLTRAVVMTERRGEAGGEGDDEVAFGPGDDCHLLVLGTLRGARKTIDVCVYTITDDRFADALLWASRRGVVVRIVTDDEKAFDPGSDVDRLAAQGLAVRKDRTQDYMHHKFAVVDGARLVHGSFNWTRGAAHNYEDVHVTSCRPVVAAYATTFERLWRELA